MTSEELKESIYRKGFEKDLFEDLDRELKTGKQFIELIKHKKIDEDEISFRIHIKNDAEELYLNKFNTSLTLSGGEIREHTFSADSKITAMEAYRMLKFGDTVAVNKDLFKDGVKYNTWLSLDLTNKNKENGNYIVNSFHQNYYLKHPFDIKVELAKKPPVPVKQLENSAQFENIEKALKKANLYSSKILLNGEEGDGFLGVNPKKGEILVYDKTLQLIGAMGQELNMALKVEVIPRQDEEKKKSWNDQKVDWKKNNQSKGQSF